MLLSEMKADKPKEEDNDQAMHHMQNMWADYPLGDAAQMSTMQLQRQAPYRQQATLCKLTATHQSKNQQHHSVKSKVHGL